MHLEDLGLIGNCQFSALIARTGDVVWCCLPRFDAEPVFSTLLDETHGGYYTIGAPEGTAGEQRYMGNSNVLETTFQTTTGTFRVIDFAPRYTQFERTFRPTQLIRIIDPIDGAPSVNVSCQPRLGWSKLTPQVIQGSNHVQFLGYTSPLRLTTDIPLSYVNGQAFLLTKRHYLVLSWGEPVAQPLVGLCENYLHETLRYWQRWVKHCNIPPMFQSEVIRSALALKLHCFEDTGAIIASMTTSIPESPGSGRTWDYRYCWLRDAYYALEAFRMLGHFEEREQFTRYLLNIASAHPELHLAPLYRVDGTSDLEEHILADWPGYGGDGPVRIGNAAAQQIQHDIFGEMVLALAPIFLDERFRAERTPETFKLLERLARKAIAVAGTPDAGIWEYRSTPTPQTFSSLMSWAAASRMATIAERNTPALVDEFRQAAEHIRGQIIAQAWNPDIGAFASTYAGKSLDAALLEMANLRFLPPTDPRLHSTIDAIRAHLSQNGWLLRYREDDGFGTPNMAFLICSYWLVEALATVGRLAEARDVMSHIRTACSPLGLISEDCDTTTRRLWGNFPQAYSHVGLIHAAFASSPSWAEVL
ncbi:MAG: glycoside hydrolase family 15 protein [Gammaproteobacteria bacterium]|nr:glycoside hydrolase family 15 protein [Gammaproteobacteria bacterium]